MIVDGVDFEHLSFSEVDLLVDSSEQTLVLYKVDGEACAPIYLKRRDSNALRQLKQYLKTLDGVVSEIRVCRVIAKLDLI